MDDLYRRFVILLGDKITDPDYLYIATDAYEIQKQKLEDIIEKEMFADFLGIGSKNYIIELKKFAIELAEDNNDIEYAKQLEMEIWKAQQ